MDIENYPQNENEQTTEYDNNITIVKYIIANKLPLIDRDIIILTFDFGKSEREIAKMLKLQYQSTIRHRKLKALEKIKYYYDLITGKNPKKKLLTGANMTKYTMKKLNRKKIYRGCKMLLKLVKEMTVEQAMKNLEIK
jgi:hypothetical protein